MRLIASYSPDGAPERLESVLNATIDSIENRDLTNEEDSGKLKDCFNELVKVLLTLFKEDYAYRLGRSRQGLRQDAAHRN